MKIHVVHGILSPVGSSGLLGLVPYLQREGFECRVPDYGLITAGETRIVNPLICRTLYPYVERGDVFVGHSNGCAIGYELLQAAIAAGFTDGRLAGFTFINAALKRDIELPEAMWADVYFNQGDDATVAAVASAALGLSDPVWGEMGHAGYLGTNPRISNIDTGYSVALPPVSGHSDIFTPAKLAQWGSFIARRIGMRLSGLTFIV